MTYTLDQAMLAERVLLGGYDSPELGLAVESDNYPHAAVQLSELSTLARKVEFLFDSEFNVGSRLHQVLHHSDIGDFLRSFPKLAYQPGYGGYRGFYGVHDPSLEPDTEAEFGLSYVTVQDVMEELTQALQDPEPFINIVPKLED